MQHTQEMKYSANPLLQSNLQATTQGQAVPRANWTQTELVQLFDKPLLDLVFQAAEVHRNFHNSRQVQRCTLLSIKTGGCSEDCGYCPQSARYSTGVENMALLTETEVMTAARTAKEQGSTRFCMGAAWREITDGPDFDHVLKLVSAVKSLDMEVCCTLGMLTDRQAERLKEAGLTAYNHNLDTSPEYYDNIISTRVYDDRLKTIDAVKEAGISVCCGGIIGMGETREDRIRFLLQLCTMNPHPESVPINVLVPVAGTPVGDKSLEKQEHVPVFDLVRMIAMARITMPLARVRLSAGRLFLSPEGQALCFLAGANSIFAGEKLLTTDNNDIGEDENLLKALGLGFAD